MNTATTSSGARSSPLGQLRGSKLFREFRAAFETATGLPLVLRAPGEFRTPLEGSKQINPFCGLMTRPGRACSACLQFQQRVESESLFAAKTLECHAGLVETAVPIRLGDTVIGYLQTGQVFLRAPTKKSYAQSLRRRSGGEGAAAAPAGGAGGGARVGGGSGVGGAAAPDGAGPSPGLVRRMEALFCISEAEVAAAYFQTRVVTRRHYKSFIRLLTIFAEHFASVSNQMMLAESTAGSPNIARALTYIAEHKNEALGLHKAAEAARMSPFYFCKVFRTEIGLTFTEYLARARIEAVKNLLLTRNVRVSEAAYASGFQSLSQFNRVFRRVAGEAPTAYRQRIHEANGQAPMARMVYRAERA